MVSLVSNTALSGLQAASRRIENSANNIANAQSTSQVVNGETVREAFRPQQVEQVALEQGGVRTQLREQTPATVPVFDPNNSSANAEGITEYPNVSPERELITQQVATYDFKANLQVLKAEDEALNEVLNILA